MSNIHLIATETQRPNETITRQFDTAALGGSPTSPAHDCKLIGAESSSDASAKLSGSASVSSNYVISTLTGLEDGNVYHQIIRFTIAGNVLEYYYEINCNDSRPADA